MNLPGRQARFKEPNRTDLGALVADLAADVLAQPRRPTVLFGYYTGALLADAPRGVAQVLERVAREAAALGNDEHR